MEAKQTGGGTKAAGLVLMTLCAGQFLMMLDTSVMNVSIATVAKDVGTTVTGIQTAITLYTLVMAAFMITGGKLGQIIGVKRGFAIGCVIYGCGSFTTAIAPSLRGAAARLVAAGGTRGGVDPAGDRGARGLQLRPQRTSSRVRADRLGGGDRDRGGTDRRGPVHELPVLALCVRRARC